MVMLTFVLARNTHFEQIWYKKSNLSICAKTWLLEYSEFNGNNHFYHFQSEIPFLRNLVQNIKTVIFWWNLVAKLIRLCKIQWWCSLFQSMTGNTLLFVTGNTFFRQIWSPTFKIVRLSWNLVLRLIQVCKSQWLCLLLFCLQPEVLFLGKFSPKNQNCQFKMKFGNQTTLSMQNLMVIIIFSVFDRKYLFGAIRSKKLKLSF